jgi:3-hydroxypropanoate dehydrogenase
METSLKKPISEEAIAQLFTKARTHHAWTDKPVSDELLQALYDLAKWGPTSANSVPMRILFVRSKEGKEKLYPALFGSNGDQVRAAPVTAIVSYDEKFYMRLPFLSPSFDAKPMFESNAALSQFTALQSSSLQGGYFMLSARALGLDVGPMGGFDRAKVDEAFLKGTSWKSSFLCNLGYGDDAKLYPRAPRLEFAEACKIV